MLYCKLDLDISHFFRPCFFKIVTRKAGVDYGITCGPLYSTARVVGINFLEHVTISEQHTVVRHIMCRLIKRNLVNGGWRKKGDNEL